MRQWNSPSSELEDTWANVTCTDVGYFNDHSTEKHGFVIGIHYSWQLWIIEQHQYNFCMRFSYVGVSSLPLSGRTKTWNQINNLAIIRHQGTKMVKVVYNMVSTWMVRVYNVVASWMVRQALHSDFLDKYGAMGWPTAK